MYANFETKQGVVIAVYPNLVSVMTDGKTFSCQRPLPKKQVGNRKKKELAGTPAEFLEESGDVLVGDRLLFSGSSILQVLPRYNFFSRRRPGGGMDEQKIAANLDQIVAVLAFQNPLPKWNLLDRYLAAAEAAEIPVLICMTKQDLCTPDAAWAEMQTELAVYQALGYPLVLTSTQRGAGLNELYGHLQNRTSLLIGKSGVGKSSLMNALDSSIDRKTGHVGKESGKGRHTTSSAWMHPLDFHTALIDTPGTREFGLFFKDQISLAWCFREMRPYLTGCRFGVDCCHDEEPGCAVRLAVIQGLIHPRRYQSYLHLLDEEGLS